MLTSIQKNFVEEECCNCGVIWYITSDFHRNIKDNKKTFYCPNGHAQSYRKGRADELEEIITQKNREIDRLTRLQKPRRGRPVKN